MATVDPTSLFRIDIEGLVKAMLARERQPITRLQQQRSSLDLRSATLNDLRTTLNTLRSKAQELLQIGTLSPFQARSVSVSDGNLVSASADGSALPGVYTLSIQQLAKASTILSNQLIKDGTDVVTVEGTGTKTFRVSVAGVNYDVTVTVNPGDTNKTILQNIASAINASSASSQVVASVVDDTTTTSRLTLTSKSTGLANKITLADTTGTLLNTIGLNSGIQASGTQGGYVYADNELDALFTLNGVQITRSQNTISDVLPGVTFTLKGTTGGTPVSLTVSADSNQIRSKVEAFLNAYNAAIRFLKERTTVTVNRAPASSGLEAVSVVRGALAGEPTFVNLLQRLRTAMGNPVSTVQPGNPSRLSEIGISVAADGTLGLSNTAAFESALADDVAKVADLFATGDGTASRVNDLLASFVQTGGILDGSLTNVSSRVKDVNNQIASLEARLTLREQALRQKLNAFQQALDILNQQRLLLLSGTMLQ